MNYLKQKILLNLKNIPGPSIKSKILVIECDDWGSTRMPSKDVYNRLLESGIPVNDGRFNQYDTLEGKDDLKALFEVLTCVKDRNGSPAAMTPVTNVANPDFEKIRQSGFTEYHYEPFTKTLMRYGRHQDTFKLWQEGIEKGIFVPESHGREHITVQLWMKKLLEGDKKVHLAFDHEFVAIKTDGIPGPASQFRPEFYYNSEEQKPFLEHSIKDGINLFKEIFGYRPTVFVPGNGIFHPDLEKALAETGVPFLYAGHRDKIYNTDGTETYMRHTFGQKSKSGLTYYIRNCAFEPTDKSYRGIDLTLKQIEAAFRWHKPAIISTHRVNFVGGLSLANRDKGLKELKLLLESIVKRWPEVEFMSSRELFGLVGRGE